MNILFSILITIAFGFGLPWVAVGFYFYMVHGEGKVMMPVGALLVALAIFWDYRTLRRDNENEQNS